MGTKLRAITLFASVTLYVWLESASADDHPQYWDEWLFDTTSLSRWIDYTPSSSNMDQAECSSTAAHDNKSGVGLLNDESYWFCLPNPHFSQI